MQWFALRLHTLGIPTNQHIPQGLRWFAFRMSVLWIIRKHPGASIIAIIAVLAVVAAVTVPVARELGGSCRLVSIHMQGRFPRWTLACASHDVNDHFPAPGGW